jgi:hypothetical protein
VLHNLQLAGSLDNEETEPAIQEELHVLLELEDLKWRQRAKTNWLQHGDRNTRYFHACASQRKQRANILKVKNLDDQWCTSQNQIELAFISYFSNIYKAGSAMDMEDCLNAVEKNMTGEMNLRLLSEPTVEEITTAMQGMDPLKAPGPNGFSACFYQANWAIIQSEMPSCHFFNSGRLGDGINTTYIALIPKVQNPVHVSDFKPISLCNVIYKLISKVLANRLKPILSQIISCVQSAFLPDRLISDNVIIAFETLHTMQHRLWSKEGYMGLKLDMSKAYDKVEWRYLKAVMLRIGFNARWVDLVMNCVTSVKYSVLINGNPVGNIQPSRGLRQGDPISPYLFLICVEGLSSLIGKAEKKCYISGVPSSPKGPKISHLFFANDCIIFC